MQRKHVALLGFFVIMALVILTLSVTFFMPRLSLDSSKTYVTYFEGPLTGIQIGSPVTLRGIKVGQVSNFKLKYNRKTNTFNVPIYINFYRRSSGELADHDLIDRLIKQGLRTELHVQNLVTGSAAIEIEFRPGSKGYVPAQRLSNYTVIPSVPDDEKPADLNTAINAAKDMFDSIKQLANSKQVNDAFASITNASNQIKTLASNVDDRIPTVSSNLNDSLQELNKAAYSISTLSDYLSRHPEALIKGKGSSAHR